MNREKSIDFLKEGAGRVCSRGSTLGINGMGLMGYMRGNRHAAKGGSVSGRAFRRAFTLVDVLVTIAVIGVLIGILIPTLSGVNEAARRVACRSNVRQIGIAIALYSDQHDGMLPSSVFLPFDSIVAREASQPQQMILLRVNPSMAAVTPSTSPTLTGWDGLGVLHSTEFITDGRLFYCPSHHGENSFRAYSSAWSQGALSEIAGNYHYRGAGPSHEGPNAPLTNVMYRISPQRSALVSDGLRTQSDYNHRVGSNVFRADLSVVWVPDPRLTVSEALPEKKEDAVSGSPVENAWHFFDTSEVVSDVLGAGTINRAALAR